MDTNLSLKIKDVEFASPVFAASGTFGYGQEYSPLLDLDKVGAIVTKGLTLKPKTGNPPPRIFETSSGILNSVGLQNIGVNKFVDEKMPFLRNFKVPVIVNVAAESIDEFAAMITALDQCEGISGYEINISCPNVDCGGMAFGTSPESCKQVVECVKSLTDRLVIVKLSPNVTDIKLIALAAQNAGADALSLINTVTGMAIDIEKKKPVFARNFAGLSGPAVKPIALKMVWETVRAVNIPVIGMGGIQTERDAIEFFMAGATAIQVGTANFTDPYAILKITDGLDEYMRKNNISDLAQLRID